MNDKIKLLIGGLLAALIFFGCQEEVTQKEIIRPVKAMKVADQATFTDTRFPGITEATREVNLSFRVGGPMITRPGNVGDEVKAGDIVARIDPRDYEVNLRTVQGQLVNAKSPCCKRAQADLDRVVADSKTGSGGGEPEPD